MHLWARDVGERGVRDRCYLISSEDRHVEAGNVFFVLINSDVPRRLVFVLTTRPLECDHVLDLLSLPTALRRWGILAFSS